MSASTRWARGRWNVLRVRRPRLAERVEAGLLAVRGGARLVAEVRSLRTRVAELERDHALLAAHVGALAQAPAGVERIAPDVEAVRLAAVAFYEHRIAALEAHAGGRHATGGQSTRTSGYGTGNDR
ncbi:hypothetical protein QDR37_14825 [Amnibacterium sp. CER49]|uniref:hypothetical protein n=1 Tax=Amnibacterium sp. CER49 TaxID=3039161 RepID=UPI00244B6284|nr:hypothetical protein [Amnibacterium sp. CER49]MDH2445224.1 hypothetical protein [Amnibacterium sp. CER49]